jgi:hypothetical protein
LELRLIQVAIPIIIREVVVAVLVEVLRPPLNPMDFLLAALMPQALEVAAVVVRGESEAAHLPQLV